MDEIRTDLLKERMENASFLERASFLFVGGIVYSPLQYLSNFFSKKIRNEKQLELALNEEISKLGIKNKKITARFGWSFLGSAHAQKLDDGNYEIVLDEDFRNRSALRHELFHIYRGDTESQIPVSDLKFIYLREPRAVLYQTLGIKL